MANIKLLQEAIQAFANGDDEVADKKMRKYFVEQAQEINKKLEEEMDSEEMCEDINTGEEEDMTLDVGYKLNEEELEESFFDDHSTMNEEEEEEEEVETNEFSIEGSDDFNDDENSEENPWESIRTAFDALERMFDEMQDEDTEFDDGSDDLGDDEQETDEFSDVEFGEERVGEAFQMKSVPTPDKTEKSGVNTKSPVAKNAKSPVEGVKPVVIKDGNVDATDDKFENSDAMTVKVEDNNNVMPNGKNVMKPAKTPTNTAASSKSPLPKQK